MGKLLPLTHLGRILGGASKAPAPEPSTPPKPPEPQPPPLQEAPPARRAESPPKTLRVIMFIDEPNLARSLGEVRAQGKDLDYQKLMEHFSLPVPLTAALFYTGYVDSQVGMRGFFRKLEGLGYEVVQVRSKRFRDGSVKNADPDIKIVTDLFTKLGDYDEAILVSGDGDFADSVQHLLRLGKRVKVVSMRSRLAQELRECGAEIIFLEGIISGLLMERHMRSGPTPRQPSHGPPVSYA